MSTVFINGEFVSNDAAYVSVLDRSFLYGDGLFETMRVYNGAVFLWEKHWRRLTHGAGVLRIRLPFSSKDLSDFAVRLIAENGHANGVLRLQLSRGVGVRGYSIRNVDAPLVVMTTHPLPALAQCPVRLITSSIVLQSKDPLVALKTCNKLPQILARTQAEEQGADDALLLNEREHVAESSTANVLWISEGTICTPPLDGSVLPGITRECVIEVCCELGIPTIEKSVGVDTLQEADGVFLTSSVQEIVEVGEIDRKPIARSPLVAKLAEAYRARTHATR